MRLQAKIIKTVDVAYGGENGFNQAIDLAAEALGNIKFVQEKKLIQKFFSEIQQDSGKYVFGVQDTLNALETGAVEQLICWENMEIMRYVFKNPSTQEEKIVYLNKQAANDNNHWKEEETGIEMELVESIALLEWLAINYKGFGATLEIVTDKSQEGAQFVHGFGGIGGLLRYQVELQLANLEDNLDGININDY